VTTGFLEQVVRDKRREVATKRAAMPEDALREHCRRDVRDFHAAIARPGAVIAELKARTPTIDSFAQSGALSALAATYAENGASAISIVTDAVRFGTSLADVRAVRAGVTLPLIAKDFVVDSYQIVEARAAGADAILLIARLLDPARLRAFLDFAHGLGMSALVEAHDEADVRAAADAGAPIIGINNRDLDTLAINLSVTEALAPHVPKGRAIVSESGIRSRADVERLAACGIDAVLVGETLMRSADVVAATRGLSGVKKTER